MNPYKYAWDELKRSVEADELVGVDYYGYSKPVFDKAILLKHLDKIWFNALQAQQDITERG